MSAPFSMSVVGLRATDAKLQRLADEVSRRAATGAMQRALAKAAQPMAETARALVPVRRGNLRKWIRVSTRLENKVADAAYAAVLQGGGSRGQALRALRDARRATKTATVEVFVGPIDKKGRIHRRAHLVEYGTAPHVIRPKGGKPLRFRDGSGEAQFAREVRHPGSPPQPYMRPAYDQTRTLVVKNTQGLLEVEINASIQRAQLARGRNYTNRWAARYRRGTMG